MRDIDNILALYKQRVAYYSPIHSRMRTIQSIYNGTMEVPLPDLERSDMPSAPNLLAQGVDQMAGRITSVVPSVTFSSVKPGIRKYDRNALTASRTVTGWWQLDALPQKMKQRGRHLIAYAMSPVHIRWDNEKKRPIWQPRHPLETFASTDVIPGHVVPQDCIFAYRRTAGWLRSHGYGDRLFALTGKIDTPNDTSILLIEYVDADETHLLAAGYRTADPYAPINLFDSNGSVMQGITLERYPNMTGMTPVVIPQRITLDQATGQFDNMVGMYYMQSKLMALEVIAVEKGIFPDTYLVSRPGEVGRFLDGPHDGRTGMVNIIAGGDIRDVQAQPGYLTHPTIDRLERNQRVTAGIPAEFGGESNSNIRTGRRGDAVLSAVIDYPVAEAQEAFAYALQHEDRIAIELAKAWDGNNERTIFVGTGNSSRPVTYVANETFENPEHIVSYPATGADLNSLIIGVGQRVGLGIMSKRTAATLDPYIDNPEQEHDAIISEGLEQALMSGIQQKAASGEIPPLVVAKIMSLVANDKMELAEALNKVTEEALKEQQAQQQQPAPHQHMTPDQAAAPAALAAMIGGGQGGPPGAAPPISGPNQSQQNLMSLLSTLRRPMTSVGGV
jgi:hypothetical protein